MKPFTKIATFVFAVVSLGHLARIVKGANVMVGSHDIPMWISYFGFPIAAILAFGCWRESKRA